MPRIIPRLTAAVTAAVLSLGALALPASAADDPAPVPSTITVPRVENLPADFIGGVDVRTRGGLLTIAWSGDPAESLFMTGPATTVFEGQIDIPDAP